MRKNILDFKINGKVSVKINSSNTTKNQKESKANFKYSMNYSRDFETEMIVKKTVSIAALRYYNDAHNVPTVS